MGWPRRQLWLGVAGGVVSAALTIWLRFYVPATDSFADIRDVPAILLAFFAGPLSAVVAGAVAAAVRAAVGLFGDIGETTWFCSSLATFCAALLAVGARRWIFFGERPSFALGAAVAAIVEMLHMAVVLTVGAAEYSNAFAVVMAAIPFQCGGTAAIVAVASLALNRRQDGRENLAVGAIAVPLVTIVVLAYFAMERQAVAVAEGRIPATGDLCLYPCNLATVLYGIVLSILAFAFAVYVKRVAAGRKKGVRPEVAGANRFTVGLRGKFAISLVVVLGAIGGLISMLVAVKSRVQYELGYSETAVAVAQLMAKYIDGESVRRFRETKAKDGYYEQVQTLLKYAGAMPDVKYLFVMVPDDEGGEYVWGTGVSPEGVPDDLGVRENHFDKCEIRMYGDVFRQELPSCCFIHRSETYGHLMSAAVPILGADGKPVALVCIDVSMDHVDKRIGQIVLGLVLMTAAVVLVALAGYYFFVSRFIVSPAERQIEAEEERIHAELNVARKIQSEALPSVFPAFPDRPEFDIYAMMVPAKEVGGDFYDFFLIGEERLAVVIGDVSDKGVPAALFMMTAKTLIRARAHQGGTPAEILRDVNDQLCKGNRSGMFATVYLAIVDLGSGRGVSANAGHEHPVLRRAGGEFAHVRYPHDPMVGVCPGLAYADREFELRPGDTLLVYTDGVTECANAERAFYGKGRVAAFLNGGRGMALKPLLEGLRADIAAFAGSAPQSDDVTLLAVTYLGPRRGGRRNDASPPCAANGILVQ